VGSLPASLLSYRRHGSEIAPVFLDARDHGWIRLLIAEYDRFSGEARHRLTAHLREPLPFPTPARKRRLVTRELDRLWRVRIAAALSPRHAREQVFGRAAAALNDAASRPSRRAAVLAAVAAAEGVTPAELDAALFADLPGERRLVAPEELPSVGELELHANLALVQGLLARSTQVRIDFEGNARAVVRHAKLCGLICNLSVGSTRARPSLLISGPLSLFRPTILYGRQLGALVPVLAFCHRFALQAELLLPDGPGTLAVQTGDPVFPARPPRLYDSKLEARLARDLARLAPEWIVVREPEPLASGNTLIFPDFGLTHQSEPARRYLVEVLGFWTPQYLHEKLARLRQASMRDFVLCIDAERNCGDDELPASARVLRFKKRVDVPALMAALDGLRMVSSFRPPTGGAGEASMRGPSRLATASESLDV
jgi:uncharacterized protein